MAQVAYSPKPIFDGREGNYAPFKAEYVSSLVETVVNAEIETLYRLKNIGEKSTRFSLDTRVASSLQTVISALEVKSENFPLKKFNEKEQKASEIKIGIVGGGIAGLYTALILKHLGIDYEILEANPDRIGGRLYTHYFTAPGPDKKTHDYYDIGAMRFPNSPIMARTFDLFRRLDMGVPGKPRTEKNVLIPYYLTGRNCPTAYNDVSARLGQNEKERTVHGDGHETQDAPDPIPTGVADPFKVSTANGGTVPSSRVSHAVTNEILNDAYDRFRRKIKAAQVLTEAAKDTKLPPEEALVKQMAATEARQRAYEYLMRHDKYSLREYLQNVEGYDPDTVHWLETTDSASGWYDMAFTENVFESLAFGYDDADNENDKNKNPSRWYCVEGGTSITVDRIVGKLDSSKIHSGKVVSRMALLENKEGVSVTFRDYNTKVDEERTYSAVVNTTTLGALQKMDLTEMELPYGMKTAIRVLRYDTSTKVGIRFKKMWWKEPQFDSIDLGGVAKTDLPIRVCVYPSYNIKDDGPGVLLASYTWGQDSERIAAHVSTNSPDGDKGLKELMIYNLARLHTVRRDAESKQEYNERFLVNKQRILDEWDTHHAYDWSKDEFSAGAFALFSPGQFTTLIPHLVRPASDGKFVIVGEHASANHAWIVGALDSALRGLKQILTRFGLDAERDRMIKEFGDVDELRQELVAKQVIIATLTEKEMAQLRVGRPGVALVPQASM